MQKLVDFTIGAKTGLIVQAGVMPLSESQSGRLSFHATPSLQDHITLSTGENLGSIRGTLTFFERRTLAAQINGPARHGDNPPPIGVLAYCPRFQTDDGWEDASFWIEIGLDPESYARVLNLFIRQVQPSWVTIATNGLEYDWHPGGKHKLWDVGRDPVVEVFGTSVVLEQLPSSPTALPDEIAKQHCDQEIGLMAASLTAFSEQAKNIRRELQRIDLGLFVIIVLLILYRWI